MTDIMVLLDELRTIARNGLTYTRDPYDRERYQRLLDVASEEYGTALALPSDEARSRLAAELGYITPKVGADAAIFDEQGRMLLELRADNQRWCIPCGWIEPNETPAAAAVREVREETGLEVRIVQLIDVFTRMPSVEYGPHTVIGILYLCEVTGGTLMKSHESLDLRYWHIEDVELWHAHHREHALVARRIWQERGVNKT
jgi:8-oxo-dGTP pyrophosphatase MutT (NUDIX family)